MILAFLSGVPRKVWFVLAALVAAGAIFAWFARAERADDKANQEIGAQKVETKALETTLKRVEKSNEVRATTAPGDPAFYAECLRTARTPSRCERFLPNRQDDQRGPGADSGRE